MDRPPSHPAIVCFAVFLPVNSLVKKNLPTYEDDKLYHIIRDSRVCKARLLYYFPATEEEAAAAAVPEGGKVTEESLSSWCGWHNDHGSLTGLANAMYLNEDGEEVRTVQPSMATPHIHPYCATHIYLGPTHTYLGPTLTYRATHTYLGPTHPSIPGHPSMHACRPLVS